MVSFAQNTKRPMWVAAGTVAANGVRTFGTPTLYHWNWRGLSSNADMSAFGPEYLDYRVAVTTVAEAESVSRLDRVWLDAQPPSEDDPMATTADFYIVGVVSSPSGTAQVTFKRLNTDG